MLDRIQQVIREEPIFLTVFLIVLSAIAWTYLLRRQGNKVKENNTGSDADAFRSKVDPEEKKPFESSYYYAHNSSRKIGGYTDGLKAGDVSLFEIQHFIIIDIYDRLIFL